MRLTQAIHALQLLLKKHGDTELYFDCPRCQTSFTPDVVVAQAVHLTQQKEK